MGCVRKKVENAKTEVFSPSEMKESLFRYILKLNDLPRGKIAIKEMSCNLLDFCHTYKYNN